jgi:hypothetical protein
MHYNGPGVYPEGYTGKLISVTGCTDHGAHVNLDVILSTEAAGEHADTLKAAVMDPEMQLHGSIPVMIDEMTPDQCEQFANDLLYAAREARDIIARHKASKN